MKTAIIYAGHMRSFDKTWRNHQWMIWRHFPGAKFYCVTELDEDAGKAELLSGAFIRKVKQPEMVIPPGCPAEWTPGRPYMHEPYHISVDPRAVLGQLWMLRESWRLYEEANDPADLIIRIRPDLWFHSFEMPDDWNTVYRQWNADTNEQRVRTKQALTPWWGRFSSSNDRFAILGSDAARAYFTAHDHIPAMLSEGAPLHPETLVHYSMKRKGISISTTLKAEFSTMRKTGEMRPPEITMIDLAHASMR